MPERRLSVEPPTITEEGFEDSLATDDFLVDYFNEFLSLPASYTQTKDWFALAKQCQQTVPTFSLPSCVFHDKMESPVVSSVSESFIFDDGVHPRTKKGLLKTTRLISEFEEDGSVSLQDTPSQALLRIYLEKQQNVDKSLTLHFSTCEEFLRSYVSFILRMAIHQVLGATLRESPDYVNFRNVTEVVFDDIGGPTSSKNVLFDEMLREKSESVLEQAVSKPDSVGLDSRADWCISHKTYDIGNRKEFERFKKFLKGTLGEKYWWLWMDIERLKVLKNPGRHQRHIEKMKKCFLVSSGDYYLSAEVLSKFKLLDGSQWNEEHLKKIQTEVVKPLLLYCFIKMESCCLPSFVSSVNITGFPCGSGSDRKESACSVGDLDLVPGSGRSPGEGNGYPLQYSCLENSLDRGAWAPRFCVTHTSSTKHASAELKFWHLRQEQPRKDVDPFPQMATLLPLRPKSCIPQLSEMQKEESSLLQLPKSPKKSPRVKTAVYKPWKSESSNPVSSKDDVIEKGSRHMSESSKVIRLTSFTDISECLKPQLDRRYTYTEEPLIKTMGDGALGGFDMENLLQSLYVENRAGFFFTKFCENSGNKLWKNCVYFWFDLQAYHQLFYQETLHPFKVCKQAQYLFATYIAPSATLDIGLQQEKKREIYMKIQPPFEDLFDAAEEYILLLLLEPWTKMIKSDQVAYGKVELVEETRQLDSTYLRKLQALHKETVFKKAEDTTCEIGTGISPLPHVSKKTEYWNMVPEEYRHFNFNELLNNKLEFEHFRQFLEAHSSSMDLMCWTDIEQFRRITYRDRKQREAKSIYIKNKYLNKKYFFGPNSPASVYQQDQIMNLSGGWGKILHEQLDAAVLIEIQKHVLNRLENVWLPLFLASEQFAARQKIKVQIKDIAEELLLQKRERKIGVWKPVESKWISSSCEIIAFRKALLNPVTARQFQRFVALKGDLLENGVLFWQEVQKYKDLCHSHCDESIIHKKIMTIINCFINSSIPPALQIDIPVEQAQKIIEHRKELGPYVFREAQMTVFGVLFKFWPQFCEFRKNLTDEKIMSVLERRQEYSKQKKKMAVIEDEKFVKDGIKQYSSTSGSVLKTATLTSDPGLGMQAYGRQPTWCYSKYIEALEQERILLKIQEELERKLFAATPSFTNFKSAASTLSLKKTVSSHNIQSEYQAAV
ncbi:regulator of G-protein signaling 22 isoform X12 [Ovis aries]|uniref:regulator of G-protein signaling 22 isoform X12 n=1 Tax=Ovis aries TaxID=9940 RepID=UPI00295264F0|nr:regulator of G-protein signaling 22 isoform X12 [Ovis aries]